jgi:hypothetical protein
MLRAIPLLCAVCAAAQTPAAIEIVTRSVEVDQDNFRKAKDYTYIERNEQRRKGAVESRTYDVLILDGRPYRRLIARGDRPLSEKEARKVAADFDTARRKRREESAAERQRRQERYEKERQESRRFLAEIPAAFDLTLLGVEQVSGVPAWVIDASPRPAFRSRVKNAEMLKKFRGRLWIEQSTYQWVKVEAETVAPIRFGLILAKLDQGARLSFEQTLVNGEIWLPLHIAVRAGARLALLKKLELDADVTFRDYRKFQTDSRVLPPGEAPRP